MAGAASATPRGSGTPRVSVVMPVRNGERFVAAAVDSILGQTFDDFEFVIVDDGSTDATPTILADYAASEARIRLVKGQGAGIVAALNAGMEAARGALVARMDGDDIARPPRLAVQVEAMDREPDLVALGSAAVEIDEAGREGRLREVPVGSAAVRERLARDNPLLHPTVMMRRDAFVAAGGYRNALTFAEDYDLWLRLAKAGEVSNLAEPLLLQRRHGGQVSTLRRLEQRAATALARRLNDPAAAWADVPGEPSLPQTLAAALRARLADPRRIEPAEGRDIAVMARAASRLRLLSGGELYALWRRLRRDGALQGDPLLPIKLWLGR